MTIAPKKTKVLAGEGNPWWRRAEVIALFLAALLSFFSWRAAESATKKTILAQTEVSGNQTWSNYRDLEAEFQKTFVNSYVYPGSDEVANIKYRQLNERLLMSADLIAYQKEVDPSWSDPQLGDSFGAEFRKHKDYFLNDAFLNDSSGLMSQFCTYRTDVRDWVEHAFKYDSKASARILAAKNSCEKMCSDGRKCT